MLAPSQFGLPEHFAEWRETQWEAVNQIVDSPSRFVSLCAPTGFGKSLVYMAAAHLSGMRTVVLTSTKGLQDQLGGDFGAMSLDIRGMPNYTCDATAYFDLPRHTRVSDAPCQGGAACKLKRGGCGYYDLYREAQIAPIVVTNYQNWLYDLLRGKHTDGKGMAGVMPVDMLILDECFPSGTLVDSRPIEDFRVGDPVTSFNEQTKRFEVRHISRLWKREAPEKMCRLYFNNGRSVDCTLNHPFWTRHGWMPAYKLLLGDVQCLSLRRNYGSAEGLQVRSAKDQVPAAVRDRVPLVPSNDLSEGFKPLCEVSPDGQSILFAGVLQKFRSWYHSEYERRESQNALQAYDGTKPDAQPDYASQGKSHAPGDGMEADSTRGKRERAFHLSEVASFDFGMADGSGDLLGTEEAFFSNVLQGRYSAFCIASCNRSGREQPLLAPEVGCQEGSYAYWSWVEGFEIYERSDRQGFASVCPDGYVYNLAVEGTHTYTAEGFVVHNCHDAVEELSSFLSVELEHKECAASGVSWPISGYSQGEWQEWAGWWMKELDGGIESLQEQLSWLKEDGQDQELPSGAGRKLHSILHEIRELRALSRKLERVTGMAEEWVIEEQGQHENTMKSVKFDPLWPKSYAERHLFRGVSKVVLTSATVRPKTLELLGVPGSEIEFSEYPSSFPRDRRPVIHVPTVRMNHKNELDDNQMLWWLRRIDLLIEQRLDRKGVIHTVSYKRARFLYDNSRHRDRMLVHGSDNRAAVIEQFKQSGPGTVLVSPSVDTGYDFHGELAEYQIIGKLPFPDTRGTVMQARTREDKDYSTYLTAQTLQQMTGRIMRSAEDRGETLIVDDNVVWFVGKYKKFLNGWWLESYRGKGMGMPVPPPKLE